MFLSFIILWNKTQKSIRKLKAILPIMKKEGESFKGQEYLGLYPFIDYETRKGTQEYEFWVNDPENGNYISLRKWLSGGKPYNHNV